MHADGRPSRAVCNIGSGNGRTAHFREVGAQRAALTPDVRPVAPTTIGWQSSLPSTALDHVSATERSRMLPPRPWVSVDTAHGQNASSTNDHDRTWGRKDPERWGAIPIHPPVQTCYKFAFALVLHAVCVSHLMVRFKYAAAPKLPDLKPEFSTTVGSRPCFLWVGRCTKAGARA